jgi:putative endonuclease
VLERNWRRRQGEVDLIVRRGRTVAFCEVKVRSSDRFGTGAEAVMGPKQRRIRRLATRWLSELVPATGRDRVELRFDVVSITAGRVEVIEGAF